jgi:hypothetical protein
MNNRRMTDGDELSENAGKIVGEMQHGIVLNITAFADDNAIDVAANHRVIPNARIIAERHVTEHDCAARDVNIFAERRFFSEKCFKLLNEFGHKIF